MDLLKWIKSLDEVLYELMSWLVFWPVTLLRVLVRPVGMMRYADAQLQRPEEDQYDQALSPPVFLILTLILTHLSSKSLGIRDMILDDTSGLAGYIDSDASAIAVRLVMFAAFPLIFSVMLLVAKTRTLNRGSLKLPFYAQCYPAAVFAAALGIASEIGMMKVGPPGTSSIVMLSASAWLVGVEVFWLRHVQSFRWVAAFGLASTGFAIATAIVIVAALLLLSH